MANYTNSSNVTDPLQTAPSLRPAFQPDDWNRSFTMFVVIAEIIIAVVSLVSNFLVVYAFVAYKKLRTSVTNYFVISLAVSDILTSGLVTTFTADISMNPRWTHGLFMCNLYTTMFLLALPSSVINLCAVTVDRYLVLRMPLRYTSLMPPRRAVFIICCLWIYAITWSCLPVLGWHAPTPGGSVIYNGHCYHTSTSLYNNLVNIINFLLPMVFMAIFWVFIYSIVHKHRKRVLKIERSLSLNTNESSNSSNNMNGEVYPMTQLTARNEKTEKKRLQRNVRGSRFIGFIVILFYFCWLPYVSLSFIANICRPCQAHIPYFLYEAFLALGFLNSALNPFLYPFHDKHFKAAFRDMWKKLRSKAFVRLFPSQGKGVVFI